MGYNDGLRRSLQRKNEVIGYRRMAERGDAFAQYNLGNCYFDGEGVEQDEEEAAKWFLKSAEQGNAMAQYRLGDCYYTGVGVEQDEEEAVKWFRDVHAVFERHGVARSLWSYKQMDFGLCDRRLDAVRDELLTLL